MALATTNPVRLRDAHLMCTCEFLISPAERTVNGFGPEKTLCWLTQLPGFLQQVNTVAPETDLAVSLVIASVPGGVRTGLVLRMRMLDDHATPAQCQAALEARLPDYERLIAREGLAPVRPLAAEGVYCLLPREGLRFLCRERNGKSQPLRHNTPLHVSLTQLEKIVASYPGSGLCITLFPNSLTEDMSDRDFLITSWGFPDITRDMMELMHLPLEVCKEIDAAHLLTGFAFLYDPWTLRDHIRRNASWGEELVRTTEEELTAYLGLYYPPTAEPTPTPDPEVLAKLTPAQITDILRQLSEGPTVVLPEIQKDSSAAPASDPAALAGLLRQAAGSMAANTPDLRGQMRSVVQRFRTSLQDQVQQSVSNAVSGVQQGIAQTMQQLQDLPGAQQKTLEGALERVQRLAATLPPPQMAAEARAAGLDQPLDSLTLMKMGFSSEQALLDAGLSQDLLCLLRSTVQLRRQCPEIPAEGENCITYAFMVGYLYEALVSKYFVPFFRLTGGNPKAHYLSDYTRVDARHMQRMCNYARTRESSMRTWSPEDWTVWMTLCNMLRSLRNRQHSDTATGFISHGEMAAAYDVFLLPNATAKRTLMRLQAFSDAPPAWAREFQPTLPKAWGSTHGEQRKAVADHVLRHATAFQPSVLQFLLRCGKIASGEGAAC
ncbi:MAG: hypothetical protein IJE07_07740 [Clostridia bacterium]|nr:hypothetical protein [Clostridia bacterium]